MKFYSTFFRRGNKVFVRGYTECGMQVQSDYELAPTLYTENPPKSFKPTDSKMFNIYGDEVYPNKFNSAKEANEFIKSYSGSGMRIWGYPRFDYAKIDELFPGTINFDLSKLRVLALDIETTVEHGAMDVLRAREEVNLITVSFKGKLYTFGCRPYHNTDPDVTYVLCDDEADLLTKFILLYCKINPDILTGWNISGFDMPYLHNRIEQILGERWVKRLSPFGWVSFKTETFNGRENHSVDIAGVSILDYLELYRKFELAPRENYKLDTIAKIELGEAKVAYDCTFRELYTDHWEDMFVPYNIQDVRLIDRLDEKLGFITIAATMAYMSKCNFVDVYRVTRIWDNIIANYLRAKDIQVISDFRHHGDTYEGAYVKPTIPGLYEWCVSFDVASLYPSLILQYNISPDTILPPKYFPNIRPEDIISKNQNYEYALQIAKEMNATLCANGAMFKKDKRGFMPELVELYMKRRKDAKSEMKKYQKEAEKIKAVLIKRGVEV